MVILAVLAAAALLAAGASTGTSTAAGAGPEVALRSLADGEFAGPDLVVDGLAPREVLRVTARGFPPDTTGRVAQCAAHPAGGDDCRDRFPVRFDGAGTARFQYLVVASAGPRGCGPRSGCVLRLGAGGRSSVVPLVFGRRVGPAGRLSVTPGQGVEVGDRVRVAVEGVAPGARLAVVRCAPPGVPVAVYCDEPEPVVVAGPDGRATAVIELSARPVGATGRPCRRGSSCGLAAVGEGGLLRTPVAILAFAGGPGASYDGARLAAGLAAAALLLAMAAWLVRRTDWREPTEASTPALDAATLDTS